MTTLDALVSTKHPKRIAIRYYAGNRDNGFDISYECLHECANAIAHALKCKQLCRQLVAIVFEKDSWLSLIAMLGVLRSCNHFVCLPLYLGEAYVSKQLQHLRPAALLTETQDGAAELAIDTSTITVSIQLPHNHTSLWLTTTTMSKCNDCHQLAYIMQTSGSTGAPKVVRVPHACIVPNITDLCARFELECTDRVLLCAPLTFDPSVVEVFCAWHVAASVVVLPREIKGSVHRLLDVAFNREKVTVAQMTPSLLRQFDDDQIANHILSASTSLRMLCLGGEPFPTKTITRTLHSQCQTRLFNIYGVTEVSCWATCHHVTRQQLQNAKSTDVPLGVPLFDTQLAVLVSNGTLLSLPLSRSELLQRPIEGELCCGSSVRRCLVDQESWSSAPRLRPTGDLVKVDCDGAVYWLGRADHQIKRVGKRINLKQIEMVCMSVCASCCALYHEMTMTIHAVLVVDRKSNSEADLVDKTRSQVAAQLPVFARPDRYHVIDSMPLNSHGKIDRTALLRLVDATQSAGDQANDVKSRFLQALKLFQEVLSLDSINIHANLRSIGLDSLKAVQLLTRLQSEFKLITDKRKNALTECLLHPNSTVDCALQLLCDQHKPTDDVDNAVLPKRLRLESNPTSSTQSDFTFTCTVSYTMHMPGVVVEYDAQTQTIHRQHVMRAFHKVNHPLCPTQLWSYNTGKCIDASPIVVNSQVDQIFQDRVIIGSHSGLIACLEGETGNVVWTTTLSDRVEGTAAVSLDLSTVVVGCYDGYIYALAYKSGDICWCYKTGDVVKSTPVFVPFTDLVIVGGHDRYVYAIEYKTGSLHWRTHVNGAVLSTPCLCSDDHLAVATLSGAVTVLNLKTGQTKWTTTLSKPVFGTMLVDTNTNCLVVPCLDEYLHVIRVSDGIKLSSLCLGSPLFSGPIYVTSDLILQTTQSGRLVALRIQGGSATQLHALWTHNFGVDVQFVRAPTLFPILLDVQRKGEVEYYVVCASTKGQVWRGHLHIADRLDSMNLTSFQLPGEVFSTPVIDSRGRMYIGCRDDCIYVYKL